MSGGGVELGLPSPAPLAVRAGITHVQLQTVYLMLSLHSLCVYVCVCVRAGRGGREAGLYNLGSSDPQRSPLLAQGNTINK